MTLFCNMVIFVQQEHRGPCQLQASPHRLFDRTRHHHRRLQVGATWLGLLWYSQGALWPCWHPLHWRDYLHFLLPRSWFLVLVQAINWRRFDPHSPHPLGRGREVKAEVAFHTRVWLGAWANWAQFSHWFSHLAEYFVLPHSRWWTQECWPSSPSFSVLGWSGAQSRPSTSSTPTRSWAPPYLSWASWAWPTLSLPSSCSTRIL